MVAVVAGAVAGEGDVGEAAGSGPGAADATAVLRLLRGGGGSDGGRERAARALAAFHGADPHQRAAHPPARAQPAGGRGRARPARGRRGARLAVSVPVDAVGARRRRLDALLVQAAAERARVVGRRAHAGPPAPRRRRDADGLPGRWPRAGAGAGERDARGRSGAVVRGREDWAARPPGGCCSRHGEIAGRQASELDGWSSELGAGSESCGVLLCWWFRLGKLRGERGRGYL